MLWSVNLKEKRGKRSVSLHSNTSSTKGYRVYQATVATVQKDFPALIVMASKKHEDALDQKVIRCNAKIHRSYSQNFKDNHRSKHLFRI